MSKFVDKMMEIMKLNDYEEEEEEVKTGGYEPVYEQTSYTSEPRVVKRETTSVPQEEKTFKSYTGGRAQTPPPSKVVNFQASVQMEVIVIQPETYDEAQDICDHIRSQRPVIINLESMERAVAQRIMDFVSGSCYTLNGNLQRVTNNIFIIAPENIEVAGNFREELKSNGIILPWKNE